MAKKRKKENTKPIKSIKAPQERDSSSCYEGDRLDFLLGKLQRSVELAKASKGQVPDKIWTKLQFAIGVNDVTRVLERMPLPDSNANSKEDDKTTRVSRKSPVTLQAVLLATDCNPKWLTKHIPVISASRNVPVLALKDNKGSSLRLGELVNVRTALAIGIKARNSCINKTIEEVISSSKAVDASLATAQ
ncbi:Ribosomal protein L7Ae/L30e/S12e/Gadd45 family [Carex littledalei]|uniref:Ribosomal protein L7Ae/L30e/S12e/Gadd45 family n=1 Tax=Carex littledalei TaxID=544730 RepID=A0A833QN35_9POAL|nr:Ribosomal protein L7Ae/L30e/S12e/Gadd45 family [Carex littledalei]